VFVVSITTAAAAVVAIAIITISASDLIDDAAFTFGVGAVRCPGIFALHAAVDVAVAVAEDVVDKVGSSDSESDFVEFERRERSCGDAASGGDQDQKRNQ